LPHRPDLMLAGPGQRAACTRRAKVTSETRRTCYLPD
jgi:hypothetical protein